MGVPTQACRCALVSLWVRTACGKRKKVSLVWTITRMGFLFLMIDIGDHQREVAANREWMGHSAIGAGDTFIAGVIFGMLRHDHDWDPEAKLRFAVDLATTKVQREGFAGLADLV